MTIAQTSVSTWSALVEQIEAGSELAVEKLYQSLRTIRFYFRRQLGPDRADDAYHSLIIDLVGAIKTGKLRKPATLPAYARAIARGKSCRYISEAIRERRTVDVKRAVWLTCDSSESPEQIVLRSERQAIAERVLKALPPRMRETLIRFYLDGESEEEIRAAMGMSHNQFRLIKSRAKLRYVELVQQSMNKVPNRSPENLQPFIPLTATS